MIHRVVFFFFVIAISVFEAHAEASDTNITLSASCLQETNLTQEFVDSFTNDSDKEPTEEYYCYMQCIFTGIGLLHEDGAVDMELFKSIFEVDGECLDGATTIVECNDMKAFEECDKE